MMRDILYLCMQIKIPGWTQNEQKKKGKKNPGEEYHFCINYQA